MLSLPTFDCAHSRSISFKEGDAKMVVRSSSFKKDASEALPTPKSSGKSFLRHSLSFKNWEPEKKTLEPTDSLKKQNVDQSTCAPLHRIGGDASPTSNPADGCSLEVISPRPKCELDAAAVKLQKVYKSYRTRRNLADCAVVVEELWWKALDFACLKQSSVSFFKKGKQETATSRWARAKRRVAKVGKGLSKDEKAKKLALQHWLEAIDPRHRYGHNLHIYYDSWFASESTQPFFYWLDVGDGKDKNLPKCPRIKLQQQCIKYLGPNEREAYEVIVTDGKLIYKQSDLLVNTVEGSKWIFVLSTSRNLYVGQKKKGTFQHSSFLAGAATTAAGRLVAKDGILKAIWSYSGHYLPTEDNFKEFISFLTDHNLDLTNVKKCSVDDDEPLLRKTNTEPTGALETLTDAPNVSKTTEMEKSENKIENLKQPAFEFSKQPSCKWTTGAGPRITCVRDYSSDLQSKALELVNLSPGIPMSPITNKMPIPSPRPSPNVRLSPRLAVLGTPSPAPVPSLRPSPKLKVSPRLEVIGIPSPRVYLTLPTIKKIKQKS